MLSISIILNLETKCVTNCKYGLLFSKINYCIKNRLILKTLIRVFIGAASF